MPTFLNVLEKVKIRGDVLLGKVYGYTDQYAGLKELLLSNTFTVVPSLRHGISQKNNADILLVIDALEVAYTNPLIDSFCIVSGDSDYTPLVGKLKSMGKFVLGISRSEAASSIFINACNEFQFLENVGGRSRKPVSRKKASSGTEEKEPLDEQELNKLIESILDEQTENDEIYASELKGILLRLRPDFNEKAFGFSTFGKLLDKLQQKYGNLSIRSDNFNVMVSLKQAAKNGSPSLTKDNWLQAFRERLQQYKDDGFDRINPSILKADIQSAYPDFSERGLGFKRFSDLLKTLEKENILKVEMDEQNTMLIKVP
ncbi:MAG: NYN domain-containing protein [Firmicutes bacterium]|nr:NYN domain-containing protein [Bacillota bacterium]